MLSNALANALTGLRANGRLADITAGNLANALTPGYGRQDVSLTSSVAGGQGTGVRIAGITRALDPELSAARRLADGDLADAAQTAAGLARLEAAIGGPGDAGSLSARLGTFLEALRQLGETPESAPRQTAAARAAGDLVGTLNAAGRVAVTVRERADADIAATVGETNRALASFAEVNRQIQLATATGRDTASLIDRREGLIDTVAAALPIRESRLDNGVVELRTMEGIVLADIRSREIQFTPQGTFEPGLGYASGTLSGLTLQGIDITPGGAGPQAVQGGRLAGLFALRDEVAPRIERQIDSLAADLAARLADPAVDPTLAPGDVGLLTDRGLPVDVANTVGLASRLALNAAVDPGAGGDPARLRDGINAAVPRPASDDTIVRALSDALTVRRDATATPATEGIAGLLSAADRIARVVEDIASARVASDTELAVLGTARETLATQESTRLGVDSDAELSRLVEIEQAYAANAQVIQTVARMLDELRRIG